MCREEANRAIEMYSGYALDHFILSVSIAENRKSNGPRYATGRSSFHKQS